MAWIRLLIKQCRAASVPVFDKQLGDMPHVHGKPLKLRADKAGDPAEWPEDMRVREFPSLAAR